ncbi:MAG: SDR family NAD(P)-dependent oxidoreductase [Chitinophagaceae bacterium]|nr:SDR family NAD(P)-dependent oxidoreductase [Chitinophagaceae bacterium]
MKTAIITGATQGIGAAIAAHLAKEHFTLIVCSLSIKDLETLQKTLTDLGSPKVYIKSADLGNKDAAKDFAHFALNCAPHIDMLVNNAGIFIPGDILEEEEGQLEMMLDLNLIAPYAITRIIAPKMKTQKSGHIFNICSVASLKAYPMGGSYSISKYALLGFSENLRQELKMDKIKVTAICPGATNSRSWAGSGVPEERIMPAADVAIALWSAYSMSANTDVETIVMRPQFGDL